MPKHKQSWGKGRAVEGPLRIAQSALNALQIGTLGVVSSKPCIAREGVPSAEQYQAVRWSCMRKSQKGFVSDLIEGFRARQSASVYGISFVSLALLRYLSMSSR